MAFSGTCCDAPSYHDVGRALGWIQCLNCGRFQAHDEAEHDFSDALLATLRESWWMRQPGGGVSRKQWAVLCGDGRVVCYNEAQGLHQARQSAQRFLELEPETTVYLFEIQATGLCGLHELASQTTWAKTITPGRRQRLSPLAERLLARSVPALA